MRYAQELRALLRPLGVYRLSGGASGGELESEGAALDGLDESLEQTQREMLLTTAEDAGLAAYESLLETRPRTEQLEARRAALAALLRVGGDSFTLAAVNDNLRGCGVSAVASEAGVGLVEVRFPEVAGMPDEIEWLKKIIEQILPAHLGVEYVFWYATWLLMQQHFALWQDAEAGKLTWKQMEKLVTI